MILVTREETNKVVEYIEKIDKLIHMRHHELAQENNLSLDQFHLLIHLIHRYKGDKNPTIGEIAKRSRRAQNTISERVSRLEEKGLLERVKDKDDRRISRVALTDEGRELINSINYQASKEFVFNALSDIDENVSAKLLKGLEQLAEKLEDKKGDIDNA